MRVEFLRRGMTTTRQEATGMGDTIAQVNVLEHPGIYKVSTESTSVYYIDTTVSPPLMMRTRGSGPTRHFDLDNTWAELTGLESWFVIAGGPHVGGPPPHEVAPWWLRVGSRHRYDFRGWSEWGVIGFWRIQRVCEAIELLDERPEVRPL